MRAYISLKGVGLFPGRFFGWHGSRSGEVVHFRSPYFSPEILTDPTYLGKIVIFESDFVEDRWPMPEESLSFLPHLSALVLLGKIKEAENGAHFTLRNYLAANRVCGFVPDRAELLRDALSLASHTFASIDRDKDKTFAHAAGPVPGIALDLMQVSSPQEYIWDLISGEMPQEKIRLAVWDFGLSYNLLRSLKRLGCRLHIVPFDTPPERIIALHPDGIVLAGGPIDESLIFDLAPKIGRIVGIRPTIGVGSGAILLGRAMGIRSRALDISHYGIAIPVENHSGKVISTYQAHSLTFDRASLIKANAQITHLNVCDGTIEGFAERDLEAYGVAFSATAEETPSFLSEFVMSLTGALDQV